MKMKNPIQPYAWGSHTAIAELLGRTPPSGQPEAELWMGAHPKAPSQVWCQGRWQSLEALIRQDPIPIVGRAVMDRFGSELPFLFKVLAVAQPLSIQAHPDEIRAHEGFARENELGIALTAPHRNYRDARHKPECVCALTSFTALCGFRDNQTIAELLSPIWPEDRTAEMALLFPKDAAASLRPLFSHLMRLPAESRHDLIERSVARLTDLLAAGPAQCLSPAARQTYEWVLRLNAAYPDDIGVLSPCLLHLLTLAPGQSLFLAAGNLHAYLNGVAIEVMANSDNVLRGGLTPKHVDIDELLKVLDFRPATPRILLPEPHGNGFKRYPSDADEFELATMEVTGADGHDSGPRFPSPEILLCIAGKIEIHWNDGAGILSLEKGSSAMVPAQLARYRITGEGRLFKAAVHHHLLGMAS